MGRVALVQYEARLARALARQHQRAAGPSGEDAGGVLAATGFPLLPEEDETDEEIALAEAQDDPGVRRAKELLRTQREVTRALASLSDEEAALSKFKEEATRKLEVARRGERLPVGVPRGDCV